MDVIVERDVPSVLVVDDEPQIRRAAKASLGDRWVVYCADSVAQARVVIVAKHPTCVIVDLRLGDENGLDFLRELKHSHPLLPTALMSGHLTNSLAVEACAAIVPVIAEKLVSFRDIVALLASLRPEDLTKPSRWLGSETRTENPVPVPSVPAIAEAKREFERSLLKCALKRNNWNISAAARELRMRRSLLHSRISQYGLRRDED